MLVPVLCWKTQWLGGGGGLLQIPLFLEERITFYKPLSHVIPFYPESLRASVSPHQNAGSEWTASRLSPPHAHVF